MVLMFGTKAVRQKRGIVVPVCYPQVRVEQMGQMGPSLDGKFLYVCLNLSPHTTINYSFYYMTHLNHCINTRVSVSNWNDST